MAVGCVHDMYMDCVVLYNCGGSKTRSFLWWRCIDDDNVVYIAADADADIAMATVAAAANRLHDVDPYCSISSMLTSFEDNHVIDHCAMCISR